MLRSPQMVFKNLKPQIADAIKESCYTSEVRLYNIAHAVNDIKTFGFVYGAESVQDFSKIVDQTINASVGVGCDLSVVVKGIFLGAFRASPFDRSQTDKTFRLLIGTILEPIFRYNGDILQTIGGILSASLMISKEYKLNSVEFQEIAKKEIIFSAQALNAKFAEDIKGSLLNSDDLL